MPNQPFYRAKVVISILFIIAILTMFLLAIVKFVFANGNDDTPSTTSTAGFHAWRLHPEDIHEANLLTLRIRLFPKTNAFPGMEAADVHRFNDTLIEATVVLDSVSVPLWKPQIANRPQSHIIRERQRGREALEFTRRAIQNAAGLIVVNPNYEENDRRIHCDLLLIDETGQTTNLATLLVSNGHASPKPINWGRRMPQ